MSTAPNPSVAMATVILDELVRCGVRHLVVAPGSRSGALAMFAAGDHRLRLSVAIDERSAGFWAVGQAKATGNPAVVVTTSGTAVGNLLPAVIEADASRTPLLLLTADRPASARGSGANQTIDQVKIFGGRVRFFADVPLAADHPGEAGWWRSLVGQAVNASRNGPVHLNLAFAEPLVPASDDGRATARPYLGDLAGRPDGLPHTAPAPPPAATSGHRIGGRALVVAGPGASGALVAEAVNCGLPVVAEGHSGTRLPGTVSTAHHLLSSSALAEWLQPERIVVLGHAGLSRPLLNLLGRTDCHWANDLWFDPTRTARSTGAIGQWQVETIDHDWARRWEEAEKVGRVALDHELDRSGLSEPALAAAVFDQVPAGGILAVGSSMPVRDLDWFCRPRTGVQVVGNRGASGIDGLVSTAAGAAAGSGAPVVALLGDLTLLHDGNGLLTEPRLPVAYVVINNGGGGIFSFLPQASYPEHFERIFATPRLVDLGLWAQSLGVGHHLLREMSELEAVLARTLAGNEPLIIEARSDRVENVSLHRHMTSAVIEAVEPLLQG